MAWCLLLILNIIFQINSAIATEIADPVLQQNSSTNLGSPNDSVLVNQFVETITTLPDSRKKQSPAGLQAGKSEYDYSNFKVPRKFLFYSDVGNDESSIVAQLTLGGLYVLDDAIFCYKERRIVFVSFSQFVQAIGFPIKIDEGLAGANGWFIREKQLFTLNFNSEILLVNGKRYEFNADEIRVIGGEVYFSIGILQKIFPLKIDFNTLEQSVDVISLEKLPIELAMERAKKWEDFSIRFQEEKEKEENLDLIKAPYKAASSPIVDLRYNYGLRQMPNGKHKSNSDLSALIGGDFLYLNHQLFLNVLGRDLNGVRITSGRKDSLGDLLGPLKATEFQFGDVSVPQNSLVLRGGQIGRGAVVTNFPEEFVSGFDRILVRGNMQAGWDAELYRNDQFLMFQKVSPNGIYEFQDVPLTSGANIIRLVFYGPFGQRREEIRKYFSSDELVKKGKFYYKFFGNQENKAVLNLNKNNSSAGSAAQKKDAKNRQFSQFLYGLTKKTSLLADFAKIPTDNEATTSSYSSLGLRSSFFGIYGEFNLTRQLENKAQASQISAQTRIFDQSITFKNQRFDKNFVSEHQQNSTDPLKNLANARIDGVIGGKGSVLMNSFQVNHYDHYSKNYRLDLQDEASFSPSSKLTINQSLRYMKDSRISEAGGVSFFGGNFLNYRFSRYLSFRNVINYNIKPKASFTRASNSIDYTFDNSSILNLSHNFQFPQAGKSGSTNYVASLSRQFRDLIASVSSSYDDDDGSYGMNMNLSMSVGYDMRYHTGIISAAPLVNGGIISARIFMDRNNNGIFDKGELGMPNIGILLDDAPSKYKSDIQGKLIVSQVSTKNPIKIKVNSNDIADPSLIVKKPVFKILVHPGSITNLDFPIVLCGEISGIVKLLKDGKSVLASSVKVELYDMEGRLMKETVSAYDGYYSFDLVPVGTYRLKISQSQMERLGLKVLENEKIVKIHIEDQDIEANFSVGVSSAQIGVNVDGGEANFEKNTRKIQPISLPINEEKLENKPSFKEKTDSKQADQEKGESKINQLKNNGVKKNGVKDNEAKITKSANKRGVKEDGKVGATSNTGSEERVARSSPWLESNKQFRREKKASKSKKANQGEIAKKPKNRKKPAKNLKKSTKTKKSKKNKKAKIEI